MKASYAQDGVQIYDDVLASGELQLLRDWSEHVRYESVHHDRWRPVWRIGEGEPMRGPTWTTDGLLPDAGPAPLQSLGRLLTRLLLADRPSGTQISLTPWIYPHGTALGLHRDDGDYEGSYIFYSMPEWDVHWGGLLHCLTEGPAEAATPRTILDPGPERASTISPGRGIWIEPVGNRLVTLAPHIRHFISRVDANAGDRPRTSIAGFVHRARPSQR